MERLLLVGICVAEGLWSTMASCVEPSPAEVPMKASRLSNVQASYDHDWPLVFKCDQGTGYGYIQITCGETNGWTGPARQCDEEIPFGIGSGVGVACFLFTLVITVVSLIVATTLQKNEEKTGAENEMSPRPQSPVAPAQNGNASKHHEKAPVDEGKQTDGRQTEVDVSGMEHRENNVATPVEA